MSTSKREMKMKKVITRNAYERTQRVTKKALSHNLKPLQKVYEQRQTDAIFMKRRRNGKPNMSVQLCVFF